MLPPEEQREDPFKGLNSEGTRGVRKAQEERDGRLTDVVTEVPLAGHGLKRSAAEMVIAQLGGDFRGGG